jgi:hypothetical protein
MPRTYLTMYSTPTVRAPPAWMVLILVPYSVVCRERIGGFRILISDFRFLARTHFLRAI